MLRQDERTGRIVMGNGGAMAQALEWVRWLSQVVVIPVVIAGFLWVVEVERTLAELEIFKAKGDRFVGNEELPNALVLRRVVAADIAEALAVHLKDDIHGNERLTALEDEMRQIHDDLEQLLRRMPRDGN